MSDLQKYIKERKARDPEFAKGFDAGYKQFKIGVMLKQARLDAGVTQEELASRLHTKKQRSPELRIMPKISSYLRSNGLQRPSANNSH